MVPVLLPGPTSTPPQVCMGFCIYNNAALAAAAALGAGGLDRVLLVDWDVHHGNGTQNLFEDDPRLLYISTHRYPFYPSTGRCLAGRPLFFLLPCNRFVPWLVRPGRVQTHTLSHFWPKQFAVPCCLARLFA